MRLLHEIAIFQTVKSIVIISLFETVRLSVSISLRNLYNSLNSIKEIRFVYFFFFFLKHLGEAILLVEAIPTKNTKRMIHKNVKKVSDIHTVDEFTSSFFITANSI